VERNRIPITASSRDARAVSQHLLLGGAEGAGLGNELSLSTEGVAAEGGVNEAEEWDAGGVCS